MSRLKFCLVHDCIPPSVPLPNVIVTANSTAPLHANAGLTLICIITTLLHPDVDMVGSISATWSGPQTIPGERFSVVDVSGSGQTYVTALTISQLAVKEDSGEYTCSVMISGVRNTLYNTTGNGSISIHTIENGSLSVNITNGVYSMNNFSIRIYNISLIKTSHLATCITICYTQEARYHHSY